MTNKERELVRRRMAFKVCIGELLNDTGLSYLDIGKAVGKTARRIAQIRRELGLPRRIGGHPGRYLPVTPAVLDTPTEKETGGR
jgi:hypothetical protein